MSSGKLTIYVYHGTGSWPVQPHQGLHLIILLAENQEPRQKPCFPIASTAYLEQDGVKCTHPLSEVRCTTDRFGSGRWQVFHRIWNTWTVNEMMTSIRISQIIVHSSRLEWEWFSSVPSISNKS